MMRRLLFFLITMACPFVSVTAQTYEAVYVYLNDGELNAFLKSDLDSIRFSTCDVDGMEHATWQTQEFYTADSIYRIPISKIDSVRMVTPEPVLAQGVSLGRDSWLKYVKTYSEQTIILNANIPAELIPEVGQVLLAYPNEEPIKEGFSGRVKSVTTAASGIVCLCEEVGISDLYERILIVGKAESENTEATENQSRGQKRDFATGTNEKVYIPSHLPGTLKVGDNLSVEVSLDNPSLTLDYLLCYGEENLKDMVYFKYQFSADGNISVAANISKDYEPEPREFAEIPVNFYGLTGSLVFATYFKASGSMGLSFGMPVHVTSVDGFRYIEGEGFSALGERYHNATWDKPEWSVSLDGSLETGLAISLAAGIVNRKFASIDLTTYVGPKVSSSFTITSNDGMNTTLYDMLKDVEVTTSLGVTFEPGYRVWLKERENFWGVGFSFDFLKTTRPLLPEISNPQWKPKGSGSGVLTANLAKDIFIPVKLGWVLYDDTDNIYDQSYFGGTYWMENEWPIPDMSYTLRNLSGNYNYKAYPVVRLFNKFDIRVPEYAEVEPGECPAKITEFKQTASEKSNNGFKYNGTTYKYKFEVATTVECSSDNEDIDDWGYAYEDPNGSIAHISLSKYTSPYTDTRYVYYRNEPTSTARLYGYVRYADDTEYVYDEPHDYPLKHSTHTCPDDHHPHLIDLGLPSGTKWACCNIGASMPSDYGGKYAWGETEEKYDYSASNYKFAQASNDGRTTIDGVDYNFIYIGESICGTSYDVANVKWGNTWRMPSVTEMEELVSQCLWELDVQDGSYVYKVTGPNEASIVLPGYYLRYWTGNLNHEASNWFGIYEPIPYVLWSDPSPHVHSPVGTSSHLGYFTAAYQGIYVRAVSDSNINSTRKMVSKLNSEVEQVAKGTDNNITVVVKEKTENTKYGTRTFCELNNK